jgi:hypothetical protein
LPLTAVGAKEKAVELINCLAAKYPRRPAMMEELAAVKNKLAKNK